MHSPASSKTHPSEQVHVIVLTGTLSKTVHMALFEHGLISWHGLTHFSLMHARRLAQSTSILHSGSPNCGGGKRSQYVVGSPSGKLSGQRHEAAWFLAIQIAFDAHGALCCSVHGFMQCWSKHMRSDGQSMSYVHSVLSHFSNGLPKKPGGHWHAARWLLP